MAHVLRDKGEAAEPTSISKGANKEDHTGPTVASLVLNHFMERTLGSLAKKSPKLQSQPWSVE